MNKQYHVVSKVAFEELLNKLSLNQTILFYPYLDGVYSFHAKKIEIDNRELTVIALLSSGDVIKNVMFSGNVDIDKVIEFIINLEDVHYDAVTHFRICF